MRRFIYGIVICAVFGLVIFCLSNSSIDWRSEVYQSSSSQDYQDATEMSWWLDYLLMPTIIQTTMPVTTPSVTMSPTLKFTPTQSPSVTEEEETNPPPSTFNDEEEEENTSSFSSTEEEEE